MFFTHQPKAVSSEILYPVTLRKLRLREHNSALTSLLVTLDEIISADLVESCLLRDSLRFGHFVEVFEMLQREKRQLRIKNLGKIAEILGTHWMVVEEEEPNLPCFVLLYSDLSKNPKLVKDGSVVSSSESVPELDLPDSAT